MKKRKEKILHIKEQSTEQSTVQPLVKSSVHSSVQSAVQSNYIYGVGILAVLATGVVYFLHTTRFSLKIKNKPMNKKISYQNDAICFKNIYNK